MNVGQQITIKQLHGQPEALLVVTHPKSGNGRFVDVAERRGEKTRGVVDQRIEPSEMVDNGSNERR